MRVSFVLAAALMATSALAAGQAQTTSAVPGASTKASPQKDPNKIRCKREEVTGSLAGSKKECHTEAEWQALAAQGREAAKYYQEGAAQGQGH